MLTCQFAFQKLARNKSWSSCCHLEKSSQDFLGRLKKRTTLVSSEPPCPDLSPSSSLLFAAKSASTFNCRRPSAGHLSIRRLKSSASALCVYPHCCYVISIWSVWKALPVLYNVISIWRWNEIFNYTTLQASKLKMKCFGKDIAHCCAIFLRHVTWVVQYRWPNKKIILLSNWLGKYPDLYC